jgi:hypothetical protein
VFGTATIPHVHEVADVRIGPAAELASAEVAAEFGLRPEHFAIRIQLDTCGRRAARSGVQRLREVLGAFYYAAILSGQAPGLLADSPGGIPPGAFVVGPSRSQRVSSDLLRGEGLAPLDVAALSNDGFDNFDTVVSLPAHSFGGQRIALSLAWLQRGVDALSYSDSVLALGVGLEVVVGDTASREVMTVLTRRLPYLLLPSGPALDRLDVIDKTRTFYEHRSKVAHGRLTREDELRTGLTTERRDFAAFLSATIAAFVSLSVQEKWSDERAMQRWFELAFVA